MILLLFLAVAAVHGTVTDSHKHPVAAVAVLLEQPSGTLVFKAETDLQGAFRFPQVTPGSAYTLRAEKDGFTLAASAPFELAPNGSKRIDLTVQPVPEFYDEPHFVVAGVTDTTNRGGHGSDTILRSTESLAQATAALDKDVTASEKQRGAFEAVQAYQRAAERDPTESNLFDWGAELLVHRATEPAIQVFSKGVRLHPSSVRMLLGLAVALYTNGAYQPAAQRFFEACDKNPTDASPYLFLAKVQTVAITQLSGYTERMARFARLQPTNAWAQYYYAVSLWKQRQNPDEVAALLQKAVQLNPTLAVAYLQQGILHFDQNHLPQALAAFEKAILIEPQLEEAHYRLAQTYRRTANPAAAGKEFAIYEQLSKASASRRVEMPQFIYELRR